MKKIFFIFVVLLLLLILAVISGLTIGQIFISPLKFFKGNSQFQTILWQIRWPRILLAILVGASLSTAGATLQGILRNPLADPFILGVSSGAALMAVVSMLLGLPLLPFWAFLGALITIAILFLIVTIRKNFSNTTIILTGIIISSFFSACIMLIISISGRQLQSMMMWLMGSLSFTDSILLPVSYLILIITLIFICIQSRNINAMILGENEAKVLGINTMKLKINLLIAISILTGLAVSLSGLIGYVGLIVPHMLRLIVGYDYRLLLPSAAVGGAIFLIIADLFSRSVVSGSEFPIGVVTALIGTPFFIYLFLIKKNS